MQIDSAPANACSFTDGEPHRWMSSSRYSCRRCGLIHVRYDLQAQGVRSYWMPHWNGTTRCRGRLVRELMCSYCGLFRRMLAK